MNEQHDKLPDPDERPSSDVVIYDGQCRLCRASARLLDRFDRRGRLSFLPLQDERAKERYPDLSREDLERHVYAIERSGRRHAGAAAVRYLSRALPPLWPLAPALHFPGSMPFWRWFYHQVSSRRHLFNCRKAQNSTNSQKEP